jgi:hypothetical protein
MISSDYSTLLPCTIVDNKIQENINKINNNEFLTFKIQVLRLMEI